MDQRLGKYQLRPIIVDAWRYTDPNDRSSLPQWLVDAVNRWPTEQSVFFNDRGHIDVCSRILLQTCPLGYWIIQEPCGDLNVLDNDAFWAMYQHAPLTMEIFGNANGQSNQESSPCEQQSGLLVGRGDDGSESRIPRNDSGSVPSTGQQTKSS
jgi:hypothetical protein